MPSDLDQFKKWFKVQAFYTNLVFVHGDQLFDFETSENAFRVLAVQTAWCVWQELTPQTFRKIWPLRQIHMRDWDLHFKVRGRL